MFGTSLRFWVGKVWRPSSQVLGVDDNALHPPPALPHILAHIVNAATPDLSREIESPCPIDEPILCALVVRDGMLRLEGLFDVFDPSVLVACPCVHQK